MGTPVLDSVPVPRSGVDVVLEMRRQEGVFGNKRAATSSSVQG